MLTGKTRTLPLICETGEELKVISNVFIAPVGTLLRDEGFMAKTSKASKDGRETEVIRGYLSVKQKFLKSFLQ